MKNRKYSYILNGIKFFITLRDDEVGKFSDKYNVLLFFAE